MAQDLAASVRARDTPMGLSDEFAHNASRQALWTAFLKKNALQAAPLPTVVAVLRAALMPALHPSLR